MKVDECILVKVRENGVLHDITASGKEIPWRDRKIESLVYAHYLDDLNKNKTADKVRDCGDILTFAKTPEGQLKLYQTWFCKNRLCPMCNYRRSLKQSYELRTTLDSAIKQNPTGKFVFLTLTQKNCKGSDLRSEIQKMNNSFSKMMRRVAVSRFLIGYARSIEITIQQGKPDYCHPHMHVILFLKSSFFKNKKNYINNQGWATLWRSCMGLNYDPVVKAERIKPNNKGDNSLVASAKETAKYAVKQSDYLTDDVNRNLIVIDYLLSGLANTRSITYGGILRQIHSGMFHSDVDDDLINIGPNENEDKAVTAVMYVWDSILKNYYFNGEFNIND